MTFGCLETRVYISLPEKYKGKVEGLCGNYDDNVQNEFNDLSTGQLAATPMEFAKRWKTLATCPDLMSNVEISPCDVCPSYTRSCMLFKNI